MSNFGGNEATIRKICRSRAFRAGWEDYRLSRVTRFDQWEHYNAVYEIGRQVAAMKSAEGELIEIPDKTRLDETSLLLLEIWTSEWLREVPV